MKKDYVKPEIEVVELRPEEQIGNCNSIPSGPNSNNQGNATINSKCMSHTS